VSVGKVIIESSIWDVRNSLCIDPGRSDAVYQSLLCYYRTNAASEVSWTIVLKYIKIIYSRRVLSNDMLNPDYITGLVDGEGSFTVYVRNPDEKKMVKRRVKAEPRFYVKLVEKDKKILYDLKKYLGCGSIYFQKDIRKNHQDCYRYEVANRKELEKVIVPFFIKNHLKFPSKRKDFKIFCRIIKLMGKRIHLEDKGLRKIYKIKQGMH